jgi:hypothetical protein
MIGMNAMRSPANSSRIRNAGYFVSGLLLVCCTSCGIKSGPNPPRNFPTPEVARQAVETSLRAWQDSPQLQRTTPTIRPVMFVDQQQPPGQRLHKFEILGESPGHEGYRRFLVRLFLEEPEQSIVVPYNVFGRGPIWVYRAEDFDMIMHMDKSMMSPPPSSPGLP